MKQLSIKTIEYKQLCDGLKTILENLAIDEIEFIENEQLFLGIKRASFLSFGEKISIQIMEIETNEFQINISSNSLFALQFIDWGANSENIEFIVEEFKKIFNNETIRL